MSLHGEPVKRQQWCIPCLDTAVTLKYTESSPCACSPRVSLSHFFGFASLKMYTHTFPIFWLLINDFWHMEMSHSQNLSFVLEKLLESKRHLMLKPNKRMLRRNKVPFSLWKPQSLDRSRDIYSLINKTMYEFCYMPSWELKYWPKIMKST